MFAEKDKRYRIVVLPNDLNEVLENIKKYDFLRIIGQYEKQKWLNIIVDSEKELDVNFTNKFNIEVHQNLGTFEIYDQYYD